MTLNFLTAGVGSAMPEASTARTCSLCFPRRSFGGLKGGEHGLKGPPSSEHWNETPGSLEVNLNFGRRLVVFFFGPLVIVVSGGLSTVKPRVATELFPTASVAWTRNV